MKQHADFIVFLNAQPWMIIIFKYMFTSKLAKYAEELLKDGQP